MTVPCIANTTYWAIIPVSIEESLYDLVNIPCKLKHTSRAAFRPAWCTLCCPLQECRRCRRKAAIGLRPSAPGLVHWILERVHDLGDVRLHEIVEAPITTTLMQAAWSWPAPEPDGGPKH